MLTSVASITTNPSLLFAARIRTAAASVPPPTNSKWLQTAREKMMQRKHNTHTRALGKHPSLFPSLGQLLTPASLETSGIHSIASLRVAYERLCDQLERDDPEIGTIKGDVELRAILGEQVSGVGTLRLARVKPQRAITHAIYAAVERSWRADASAADCVRITDAGGPEAAWVGG